MLAALTPVRIIAPVGMPIALADAKRHLRVDFDDDDLLISSLIAAATERLDGWSGLLGRCLLTQDWRQDQADFAGCHLRLPFPDVSAVSVTYRDDLDAPRTLSPTAYRLLADASGSFVELVDGFVWPSVAERSDAVSVTMTVGFGDAQDVPAPIRAAILLMVGDLYRFTESASMGAISMVPMSTTVQALLAPYRRTGF